MSSKNYEWYLDKLKNSPTEMFWFVPSDVVLAPDWNFQIYFPPENEYDRKMNHMFKNGDNYDGIILFSRHKPISEREFNNRFPVERKEWDVVASYPKPYDIFEIDTYEEYLEAMEKSTTEMFWMSSKNLTPLPDFKFDLYFEYFNRYDRNENHAFIHQVNDKQHFKGIYLLSKNKPVSKREIESRHIIDRKEWDIVASGPKPYDIFEIDTYEEYLEAMEKSTTEMFWVTSRNLKVNNEFKFDLFFDDRDDSETYNRNENHVFVHKVKDKIFYNGIFLMSKNKPVSKREIESRHLVSRKEWDIVASGPIEYEKFVVDNYSDYLNAVELSRTEMFWTIPKEVEVDKEFKFDLYFTHDDIFNRTIHHSFKHQFRDETNYNGINLISKKFTLTKKEINFRFVVQKKNYDEVASRLKPYDVVFISYNEPNADENYDRLLKVCPNAKRVHGVKGIHNAHLRAAELVDTKMFWVVDGDAFVVDEFKFDYQVPVWDTSMVHIWYSQNPVNDLKYGYGGVKLLPTIMTLNMDLNTVDMTTSISKNIKVIEQVSNLTVFNTDPFNTWKSALRECVKLQSKVIDRQNDEETENRLETWKTVGQDRPFGKYAISGAKYASLFVDKFSLDKINDFDFLNKLFLEVNHEF